MIDQIEMMRLIENLRGDAIVVPAMRANVGWSQVSNNINRDVKLNEILHANTQLNKAKIQGNRFLSRDAKLLPKIKTESRHFPGNSRPQEYWENQLPTLNNKKLNARYSS